MLKTIKETKQMRLDELIKYVWDNVRMHTIKRRAERDKDTHVGNRLNGEEVEMLDLYEVIHAPVEVQVVKSKEVKPPVIKHPYRGENKRYVDYLFKSTFKGWSMNSESSLQ